MYLNAQTIITIISVSVAVASALFAWQAAKAAEKSYTVELIGLLYTTYQSEEMLRDLKIVWSIYRQIWQADSSSTEVAEENVNRGVPISEESAIKFFAGLDRDSAEFKAIHNLINFWTYLELLLRRKALKPEEIMAFTSPQLLGFLYPMARAYDIRYGHERHEGQAILEYAFKELCLKSFRYFK